LDQMRDFHIFFHIYRFHKKEKKHKMKEEIVCYSSSPGCGCEAFRTSDYSENRVALMTPWHHHQQQLKTASSSSIYRGPLYANFSCVYLVQRFDK
jgi:hypothetical protein